MGVSSHRLLPLSVVFQIVPRHAHLSMVANR